MFIHIFFNLFILFVVTRSGGWIGMLHETKQKKCKMRSHLFIANRRRVCNNYFEFLRMIFIRYHTARLPRFIKCITNIYKFCVILTDAHTNIEMLVSSVDCPPGDQQSHFVWEFSLLFFWQKGDIDLQTNNSQFITFRRSLSNCESKMWIHQNFQSNLFWPWSDTLSTVQSFGEKDFAIRKKSKYKVKFPE